VFRLETERLVLRDFRRGDGKALHAVEGDAEVARYQSFEPRTLAGSRAFVRHAADMAKWAPRSVYELAVVRRADNMLIGRCGLEVSRRQGRQGLLWYTLRRDCWGQGYATEAVRALVDYGFAALDLHRVHADCDPANERSWRLLERLGMRREAHHVEWMWLKGAWLDSYVYAVLEREWSDAQPAPRASD
jgi:ribosomal-protein-alanine N-acetyltransferase